MGKEAKLELLKSNKERKRKKKKRKQQREEKKKKGESDDVTEVEVFNINMKEDAQKKPIARYIYRYDKFMDVIKSNAFIGCFVIKFVRMGAFVYERKNV